MVSKLAFIKWVSLYRYDVVIGTCDLNLAAVYLEDGHELWNEWLTLTDQKGRREGSQVGLDNHFSPRRYVAVFKIRPASIVHVTNPI